MTLTKKEEESLAHIIRPYYASLALANDYFSFDREWQEAQAPKGSKPINAVWLHIQWHGVCASTAKQLVRNASNEYEREFLDLCDKYRNDHGHNSGKIECYLKGLAYRVSGNVVWSLNCPRCNPQYRYDLTLVFLDPAILKTLLKVGEHRIFKLRDEEH